MQKDRANLFDFGLLIADEHRRDLARVAHPHLQHREIKESAMELYAEAEQQEE